MADGVKVLLNNRFEMIELWGGMHLKSGCLICGLLGWVVVRKFCLLEYLMLEMILPMIFGGYCLESNRFRNRAVVA